MPAQVVSFLRRVRPVSRDWAQEELAEFYRVEAALLQAGMRIETDRGVTDEGDPWFAFCRADDGETFIHFARIDGRYIIAGPAYEGVAQGYDFPELVRDLISRHPLVQPQLQRRNNTNIFMHPAALLIAVVGTAFFKTADAKAAETGGDGHKGDGEKRHHISGASPASLPAFSTPAMIGSGHVGGQIILDAAQTLTLVASAMAAMAPQTASGQARTLALPATGPLADWTPPATAGSPTTSGGAGEHTVLPPGGAGGAPPPSAAGLLRQFGSWAPPAVMNELISLAAVLQDLPKAPATPAADAYNQALSLLADTARHAATAEMALPVAAPPAAAVPPPATVAAPAPTSAPATEVKATTSAAAYLVVELNSAALPNVAAIRVVRDLGSDVSHDQIITIDQIPDILARLIASGEHLTQSDVLSQLNAKGAQLDQSLSKPVVDSNEKDTSVSGGSGGSGGNGSGAGSTPGDSGTGPAATQPDASHIVDGSKPVDGDAVIVAPPADSKPVDVKPLDTKPLDPASPVATAPAETVSNPPPVETIPTPPAVATPEPVIDHTPVKTVTTAMMDGILAYFTAYAPIEVMMSGHVIVIYDTRIMTDSAALEKAESVTYTFDDGSMISLVGAAITLHAAGALI